jgi:YhcH/YjgK/YiaL family protein
MITDHISHADTYAPLGAAFTQAFAFLRRNDLAALPAGTHELDGRRLYALVQDYQSKRPEDGKWEVHRKYIDLQFVLSGRERFGYAQAGRMAQDPYDDAKDIAFLKGEGTFLDLHAGDFVVVWPGEAHMPGMAAGAQAAVRKIVVKIAVAGR